MPITVNWHHEDITVKSGRTKPVTQICGRCGKNHGFTWDWRITEELIQCRMAKNVADAIDADVLNRITHG